MEKRGSNYYTLVVPYATTSLEGVFDLNAVVYTDEQNKNIPAHTSIMLPDMDTADDISNIFFSKGIPVDIIIGSQTQLISNGKPCFFEEAPIDEKYSIVFHELNHVVITYNPYIHEVRKNIGNFLDKLTNNILHDFIIDTIGTAIQNENSMMKMALKNTAIDKYHYYNYLKNWKGTTGDLVRFLYGYTVEGIEYPFPTIDGLSQEDYNNLKDAWKNLRNGIKAIRDKIDKRQDGYFDFWHSNRIFSVEDPTKIIRDIRDVLTLFKDSLKEVDNNVQNASQNCLRSILENMAKKEQSEQSQNKDFQSYAEVIFVDAKGQALSDKGGEDGLKNYLYGIKQVTSSHKIDVGGLIKSQCPPEIRSYAKQVARKLISNTRLRIISEQANVYGHNVIIGKEADFSDGEVNMERIVDNYATILKGNAESVPFYDSYHIKPLPKISILIVTDVSGSMEMLNMTLKPFLSVFYLEGLNTLFDINIVDFSESVVKEPKLKNSAALYYYYFIAGEGGTDPFALDNLPVWKNIIRETRPEIVLFYSDFKFDTSLFSGYREPDAKHLTLHMFEKFGVPADRVYLFDVDEIKDSISFQRSGSEKMFLDRIALETMHAIVNCFQKFRRIDVTR